MKEIVIRELGALVVPESTKDLIQAGVSDNTL